MQAVLTAYGTNAGSGEGRGGEGRGGEERRGEGREGRAGVAKHLCYRPPYMHRAHLWTFITTTLTIVLHNTYHYLSVRVLREAVKMSSAFLWPTISAADGCAIIAAFPLKGRHHDMYVAPRWRWSSSHFHWPGGADHSAWKWRPHVHCGTDSARIQRLWYSVGWGCAVSLKWKQRQHAHNNGPWDLLEHKHRFWELKSVRNWNKFDRKKIWFLEGRNLLHRTDVTWDALQSFSLAAVVGSWRPGSLSAI